MAQSERDPVPTPRRSHGCLWSCLAVLLIVALAAGGTIYFAGGPIVALYRGIKNDPTLQLAMTVVRNDRVAREVLGDDIAIESVDSESFTATIGKGRTATYTALLRGTKGEGRMHVTLHSSGDEMKIVSIVLTGQDGERYNITGKPPTTPSGSI